MTAAAAMKYRIKGTSLYVQPHRASASPAYESGSVSAPRLGNWRVNSSGPVSAITGSLDVLRSRSRDMVRKNALSDSGIETLVDNWIGTGIKPQFTTRDPAFNQSLAELFLRWTDEADASGEYDFYGLQSLATRSMFEAGDVFARLRSRRRGDVKTVPLQLQVLESEYCPVEKNEMLEGLRIIQGGIEFDAIGRKVAYWMYQEHPNDIGQHRYGTGTPVRIPASEIVHMKSVRRPGMVRGEPWLTRALIKLRDLDIYDDAQLTKQQVSALFAGFISGESNQMFRGDDGPDANAIEAPDLSPGTFQVVPPGANLTFANPPSVGDSYEAFNRQQHHYIATALGVLYEQLTGDYSRVNDRQWRAAFNAFKRKVERHQHQIVVFQFCRPVLMRWVELGIVSGQIKPPAGITAEEIVAAKWIPQAHAYINPVQDVQAQREEIRSGLSSRAMHVSARGYDVEEIDAENAADTTRTDALGLVYDTNAKHVSRAGVTQARPQGAGYIDPDAEVEQDDERIDQR